MYTQIDKGALPCEAELKVPYTRQVSRIDYENAITGRLEEKSNESYSMYMGSPDKETRNTCDRAQQGKPPPSSAFSGASPHGCRWRISMTKRMNREGCHPRPWVPWNRHTNCHEHRLASKALATTGVILWCPCPCWDSDARSENFFHFKSVY